MQMSKSEDRLGHIDERRQNKVRFEGERTDSVAIDKVEQIGQIKQINSQPLIELQQLDSLKPKVDSNQDAKLTHVDQYAENSSNSKAEKLHSEIDIIHQATADNLKVKEVMLTEQQGDLNRP